MKRWCLPPSPVLRRVSTLVDIGEGRPLGYLIYRNLEGLAIMRVRVGAYSDLSKQGRRGTLFEGPFRSLKALASLITTREDIEREVFRHNARFRAWRAAGAPLEGGFQLEFPDHGDRLGMPFIELALACRRCGRRTACHLEIPLLRPHVESHFHGVVRKALIQLAPLRVLKEQGDDVSCRHLNRMLAPEDPKKVQAILELELLAGG